MFFEGMRLRLTAFCAAQVSKPYFNLLLVSTSRKVEDFRFLVYVRGRMPATYTKNRVSLRCFVNY